MSNAFTHAFAVGEVVTAATLNGLVPTTSFGTTSNTYNTAYQNTSGGIRMVNVVFNGAVSTNLSMSAYVGSTNPPTQLCAVLSLVATNPAVGTLSFMVPPQLYYTASTGANPSAIKWFEWNFFVT